MCQSEYKIGPSIAESSAEYLDIWTDQGNVHAEVGVLWKIYHYLII
jgi:hypothetical protein